MIFRYPHVFKNKKFKNIKEFNGWWEASKNKKNKGLLNNIPDNLPSIVRASKIQKKFQKLDLNIRTT